MPLNSRSDDAALARLEAAGAVGVRFDLVSHRPDALGPRRRASWHASKNLVWHAQVFTYDTQWAGWCR